MTSRRIANAAAPGDNAGVRIVLVALALAACGNPAGDAKTGAEVFAKVCTACHGATGKPDATMVAKLGVKDLTAPAFRDKVTEDKVEYQVRNGSQNKLMPAFTGAISDEQIKAVAYYVASDGFMDRK